MIELLERITGFLPALVRALPLTLLLTVVAGTAGLFLGALMALARTSGKRLLAWPCLTISFLVRGTPLLVQLYLVYYGLGELLPGTWVRQSFLWPYLRDGLWYAIIVLTISQATYNAEVLRGAIRSVPRGQIEAARAMGMPSGRIIRRIVLPQAFHSAIPVLASDVIILLKSTSLASTITVLEVLGTARMLQRQSLMIFEPLIAAALIYFAVVLILSRITATLERRLTGYRTR
ncbi:MAG: ABC transporter permease subunit [Paracoccus sp. (in: a-proteobacteria)]|uniref:ABC transporter permease n=1 Tax=Paracoccus sp. TaxID=267 RepID=UPI0039E6479D